MIDLLSRAILAFSVGFKNMITWLQPLGIVYMYWLTLESNFTTKC